VIIISSVSVVWVSGDLHELRGGWQSELQCRVLQ